MEVSAFPQPPVRRDVTLLLAAPRQSVDGSSASRWRNMFATMFHFLFRSSICPFGRLAQRHNYVMHWGMHAARPADAPTASLR